MVTPRNILAIVELVYYVPALVLAIIVSWKHGLRRNLGWSCIVVLALFRIAGACTEIAASYEHTTGLVTASIILQSFGLASLLVALIGLLKRLNDGMSDGSGLKPRIFRLIHLVISAAVIVAIVGATEVVDADGGTTDGHELQKIGLFLFLGAYVIVCGLTIWTFIRRSKIMPGEKPILWAVVISAPLLGIRIAFSIIAVFLADSNDFSIIADTKMAVVIQAFMATLEEFIIVAVIISAGFSVSVIMDSRLEWAWPNPLRKKKVHSPEEGKTEAGTSDLGTHSHHPFGL